MTTRARGALLVIALAIGCNAAPAAPDADTCMPGVDTPRRCSTCSEPGCCVESCDPWGSWGTCVPRGAPCHDAGLGTIATCSDALASTRDESGHVACRLPTCQTDVPCVDFGPCTECPFHLSCAGGTIRILSGGCPPGDSGVP